MATAPKIPRAFIWRRVHSLSGLFLVLFLMEHLLVNSQAALFVGSDGIGFIDAVNGIKSLPYLPIIEMALLGAPILTHAAWGVYYLRTGRMNSFRSDGTAPSLPEYSRNKAYSWQRITSWILLFAIAAHVIHMRFIEYPSSATLGSQQNYMVPLKSDSGLETLAGRLDVTLFTPADIAAERKRLAPPDHSAATAIELQRYLQREHWVDTLEKKTITAGEVMAVSDNFGTAELLMVRDTFKMPIMIVIYTIFVLTACYHAFNGLWMAMITWGVTLTARSQQLMLSLSIFLMCLVAFLGLAAIWGTYWINLFK